MEQKSRGISGSTLKLIAVVTMLIDHVGAVVVWRMILFNADTNGMEGMIPYDRLTQIYMIMRYIGRIAFPIYCFLLVEGFQKTRNKTKYALRLGVFALVSEIPFDLALSSRVLEFDYQNVFFTLFIGLLTMIVMEEAQSRLESAAGSKTGGTLMIAQSLLKLVILAAGALLAEALHTDYGAMGVICILVLYLFRGNKAAQITAGCCAFLWERTAPLAFIPIGFYNGKRGLKLKYFFYLFYPLHLLILYLLCVALGISGYPAV